MTSQRPDRAALKARLAPLVESSLAAARQAATSADAWSQLERAHILSQPFAGLHIKVHARMLSRAWRDRKWRELLGQLPRLVLAGPGSLFGRYPRGNRGTTAISMFEPEPVAPDLATLLPPPPEDSGDR